MHQPIRHHHEVTQEEAERIAAGFFQAHGRCEGIDVKYREDGGWAMFLNCPAHRVLDTIIIDNSGYRELMGKGLKQEGALSFYN